MTEKLKKLMVEYGAVALATYYAIFFLVLGGAAIAIKLGFDIESAKGAAGLLGAAWLATKVTQPLRILATVALTPLIAKLYERSFRRAPASPADPAGPSDQTGPSGPQ